jgi:proline dehydrogenase
VTGEGSSGGRPPSGRPPATVGAALESGLRCAILGAAESARVRRLVGRYGMRLGAARFVAGETLDEAVPVLRSLNERGLHANTSLLGEGVTSRAETLAVVEEYEGVLDRIAREGLDVHVALKLTHLGLALDEELAHGNVIRLVAHAGRLGNFVRIDMEESAWVDATLRIYRRLREAGHGNVGVVLQSYLYRSEHDLADLLPLAPNLRLVKGAYLEPPDRAYPDKADVDTAYLRLLERALREAAFTAVATHDERIIEHALAFAERKGIGPERFELQMLYGVRPQLQLSLVRRGCGVRVATPFGSDWYRYLMRRLAERPANVLFLARNLVRR